MNLERASELFAVDIANTPPPAFRHQEPMVQIPLSMATLYLDAMQDALKAEPVTYTLRKQA